MRWLHQTRWIVPAALFCVGVLAGPPARAQVIFSNLGPGDAFDPFIGETIAGTDALGSPFQAAGMSFLATASGTVASIDVALFAQNNEEALNFELRANSGDAPDFSVSGLLDVYQFPAGSILPEPAPADLYRVLSTLAPTLVAGQRYWLVGFTEGAGAYGWNRTDPNQAGSIYVDMDPPGPEGGSVVADQDVSAFRVNATPEPGTLGLSLIVAGVVAVGFARRRFAAARRAAIGPGERRIDDVPARVADAEAVAV